MPVLERLSGLISGVSVQGAYQSHVFAKYQLSFPFGVVETSTQRTEMLYFCPDVANTKSPPSGVPQSTTPPGSPPVRSKKLNKPQANHATETVNDVQNALLAFLSQAASGSQT